MKNTALFLYLLLVLTACQNEWPNYGFHEPRFGEIKGRIFDFDTKKPVKDVKLYLLFNRTNVVDSVFSDSEGNVKATFLAFDFWSHELEVVLPPNYRTANRVEKFRFYGNEDIYLRK